MTEWIVEIVEIERIAVVEAQYAVEMLSFGLVRGDETDFGWAVEVKMIPVHIGSAMVSIANRAKHFGLSDQVQADHLGCDEFIRKTERIVGLGPQSGIE